MNIEEKLKADLELTEDKLDSSKPASNQLLEYFKRSAKGTIIKKVELDYDHNIVRYYFSSENFLSEITSSVEMLAMLNDRTDFAKHEFYNVLEQLESAEHPDDDFKVPESRRELKGGIIKSYEAWRCQKCGEPIGHLGVWLESLPLIGDFLRHRCRDKYSNAVCEGYTMYY